MPESVFTFDNTYARELEGFYARVEAEAPSDPQLLRVNEGLATELGLGLADLSGALGAAIFSGRETPAGAQPLAQAYAGHQFGGFNPQLGDGRALLLGEIVDPHGNRFDVQLKGSGRTPFSRGGDGKAALGPVLREYLVSEAMHALGVPTTRALAAATTGDPVFREEALPGAVLTRVAASHVRVGTFQFFAARGETERVRRLVDYVIARHAPDAASTANRALTLFETVRDRQARLVAHWMSLGFIHGVMNTDNTAISGETIDYGPCAFMDRYDPATVFSSIDHGGRYAYGNQPWIAQWNLARFAEAILPMLADDIDEAKELATASLHAFEEIYTAQWLGRMRAKLGCSEARDGDRELVQRLLDRMQEGDADWTSTFRALAGAADGDDARFAAQFSHDIDIHPWLTSWRQRLAAEDVPPEAAAKSIRGVSPVYVPRNERVEEALAAAQAGDLDPFDRLYELVTHPFQRQPGAEAFEGPSAPDAPPYRTFCGT